MKKYSQMKNSGIKWVGDIPEDWDVKRLKFTTSFENSSVDRHTYDDEIEVSICHYPQVYRNEIITSKTIMENGTCTEKELNKFQLKKDDILITKDSETADEIGIPAYIQENCKNSVSGYHIAHLTTNKNKILGHFLFRYLQSDFVNGYFETEANGVTRFGLGKYSISNLKLILPSISEQKQIVFYLGKKTKKIDNEITKNQNLITLLQEKRQSEICHAVTKGLDDTVSMEDSGIEWFEKIPKGWGIQKIKFNYKISTGKVLQSKKNNDNEILINFITAGNVFWNTVDLNDLAKMWATPEQIKKLCVKENDLLICEGGEAGRCAILTGLKTNCILQNHVHRLRGKNYFSNKFLMYVMNYYHDIDLLQTIVEKVTLSSLSTSTLGDIPIPLPDTDDEVEQIVLHLDKKIKKIDSLLSKVKLQITNLQEFRESLISSAVTGKIKVTQE